VKLFAIFGNIKSKNKMSRIGKLVITIPPKVEVKFENQVVHVSGPYGQLQRKLSNSLSLQNENQQLRLLPIDDSRKVREIYGLSRTLINNMIVGVSTKFERRLEMKGVGYRGQVKGKELLLNLGYSHPVLIPIPNEIEVTIEANTKICIRGIDKEVVGQLAATIRSKRPPEPYKGKGIMYTGEVIKRKVGKSGK
jgi:large subunit ribosomal protein L6